MNRMRNNEVVYIGIGGCGVSILEYGMGLLPKGATCIAVDRDGKTFNQVKNIKHKLPLFKIRITGSHLEYSEQAKEQIQESIYVQRLRLDLLLKQTSRVVVIAGIGGVVGSWATLLLCNQFIEEGKLVDLVLVKPFAFEKGRAELVEYVLPLFSDKIRQYIFHNDNLTSSSNLSMKESFDNMNKQIFEALKR